jgi:hypothetical protein
MADSSMRSRADVDAERSGVASFRAEAAHADRHCRACWPMAMVLRNSGELDQSAVVLEHPIDRLADAVVLSHPGGALL